MDIIPIPSLQTAYDIEGCSAYDFTAIYVDQYVYERVYNRYRFTLAHELGHKILHQEYYNKLNFSRISEWANIVEQMDEGDRSSMEYQANMFAGMVLVPKEILRVEFNEQLQLIQSYLEKARSNGMSREDYLPIMTDAIANGLSPKFEVSRDVLRIRIEFERLEQEVL
jgi:Zn-dependent peptidase ImmA (M78 family)